MNIREKLLELRIPVPDAARRYRIGKGCLMWWPVETDDGSPCIDMLAVTREQYEAMMCAGLVGNLGQLVELPYVAPQCGDAPTHAKLSARGTLALRA